MSQYIGDYHVAINLNIPMSKLLEDESFKRGDSCGSVFYHEELDAAMVVHGDDFT